MAGRRSKPLFLDTDELDRLPATVWIPVRMPRFGGSMPQLAPRETANGVLTLPVYSTFEKLQHHHGAHGHAVEFPSNKLDDLRQLVGFATLALDAWIPPELRFPDWDDAEVEWPEVTVDTEPGLVWLPCRPLRQGAREVQIELHPNDEGELVLAAFTDREQLVASCGEHQPAGSVRVDDLAEIAANTGADVIAYNPVLRASARHT